MEQGDRLVIKRAGNGWLLSLDANWSELPEIQKAGEAREYKLVFGDEDAADLINAIRKEIS